MARHPLFRDECKTNQPAQTAIPAPAASDEEMHQKACAGNALWNRMNLAMRLSFQRSKPTIKR
jgi:hypothetical protein